MNTLLNKYNSVSKPSMSFVKAKSSIQPKLSINEPGDKYEQEADAMADKVMRMSPNETMHQPKPMTGLIGRSVQRKCARCEEDGKKKTVMRKAENGNPGMQVSSSFASSLNASKGGGSPLSQGTRDFMENAFSTDFSQVRIHTSRNATEMSKGINAKAFTVGNDIYFNEGQYNPGSGEGKHLLAHELTHTVQQGKKSSIIQKYETPEHQYLGDEGLLELVDFLKKPEGKRWATDNGYKYQQLISDIESDEFFKGSELKLKNTKITWGDAIAMMGDYYGSSEALYNSPVERLFGRVEYKNGILMTTFLGKPKLHTLGERIILHPGLLNIAELEKTEQISEATSTIKKQEITGGEYLKLAERNITHFSPKNRETYLSMHREAIILAASGDETAFQKALLIDASAGHFLTDAYASGHLFDREKVLAEISLYLHKHPIEAKIPEMQLFVGLTELVNKTQFLVLKLIHDHFNSAGYEVSNPKGMTWRTFGDGSLQSEEAEETRHIASLAVFLSRKQIYDARKGITVNPNDVIELMPDDKSIEKATNDAIAYIPTATGEVDRFILSQRDAAESQFGFLGGAAVRYMLNQIDKRLQGKGGVPSETSVDDILFPDFSIGADFILNRDDRKNPDSWHLRVSVGQPPGSEGKKEWQFAVGLEYEF